MTNTALSLSIFLILIITSSIPVAASKREAATFKLAILDTGFCLSKLPSNSKIAIHPLYFPMGNFDLPCEQMDENSKRFHGQKVLETFINNYHGKKIIEIYPVVVFDQEGQQKVAYWKEAMLKLMRQKVKDVMSATGVPLNAKVQAILPKFFHFTLASGRKEALLKGMIALFPQDYLPKKQLTIVGSQLKLLESTLKDPNTYNPDRVDVWIDELPNESFKGSSRAVAIHMAQILSK